MAPFVSPLLGRHWCWLPLGDPAPGNGGRWALGALLHPNYPQALPPGTRRGDDEAAVASRLWHSEPCFPGSLESGCRAKE